LQLGGRRSDNFSEISGSSTLPADCTAGRPSAPVTASVARHVELMSNSSGSSESGRTPAANGIFTGNARA
jgi:hypothetical protein